MIASYPAIIQISWESVEEFPDLGIAIQADDKMMDAYVICSFQKAIKNNLIGIMGLSYLFSIQNL